MQGLDLPLSILFFSAYNNVENDSWINDVTMPPTVDSAIVKSVKCF